MKMVYALLCLFLASCTDGKGRYPEVIFTDADTNESVKVSGFAESSFEERKRYQSQEGLLNYLEPLNLEIEGRFLVEEDEIGSAEIHAYTSNIISPDGSYFKITQSLGNENTIDIKFYSRNFYEVDLCSIPYGYSVNGEFRLKIQITNSLTDPNFAIWSLYEDADAPVRRSKRVFNMNTANCSSNQSSNVLVDLFGVGNGWGVVLNQIEISKLSRKVAYDL